MKSNKRRDNRRGPAAHMYAKGNGNRSVKQARNTSNLRRISRQTRLAAVFLLLAAALVLLISRPWRPSFTVRDGILRVELGSEMQFNAADWITAEPDVQDRLTVDLSQVDAMKVGSYMIVISDRRYKEQIKVEVVDTTPPRAVLAASVWRIRTDEILSADRLVSEIQDFSDVIVSFDPEGKLLAKSFAQPGVFEAFVYLTDSAGNQQQYPLQIEVFLPDTTPPDITGTEDLTIELGEAFDPLAKVAALDATDGVLTGDLQITGNVDTTKPGAYSLGYSVQDSSGNRASANRTVTVLDSQVELKEANAFEIEGGPGTYRAAQRVLAYLGENSAKMGIAYSDLTSGDHFSINAARQFRSASTAKVFVNMALYELVEKGEADLEHVLYFTEADYEGGTGIMQNLDLSRGYTLGTLADYAMLHSDNIAFQMIRRFIGRSESLDYYESIIGHATNRSQISMSALDAQALLHHLYSADYTTFDHMLEVMLRTDFASMLPRDLPDGITAHKVGFYSTFYHDIGIVYDGDRPYIIAVFSDDLADPENTIADVSKIIFDSRK